MIHQLLKVIISYILLLPAHALSQPEPITIVSFNDIVPGDAQMEVYLPLISNKKIALVANHTSMVGNKHLVDTLVSLGIGVKTVFTPEHGYRGNVAEGEAIGNTKTTDSNIEVISLYGKKKKPSTGDLKGIDAVVFDLQDVGARFYTYLSTLTLVMEACAEHNIPIIVLDRPNPNGFYIDGPVLDTTYRSFVGMHPIPVVYGMTIGEFAKMINGEGWLTNGLKCNLRVIPLKNYTHNMVVKLPVKPSPNLPNWRSVYLYPSLCFFEGTIVSVGRGTKTPFQIYGHPDLNYGTHHFTPRAGNISKHPKLMDKTCYGEDLQNYAENYRQNPKHLHLVWLIKAYNTLKDKKQFFNGYFDTLAGTDRLRNQIIAGMSEWEIRQSWQKDLARFKLIREKYLLYP